MTNRTLHVTPLVSAYRQTVVHLWRDARRQATVCGKPPPRRAGGRVQRAVCRACWRALCQATYGRTS